MSKRYDVAALSLNLTDLANDEGRLIGVIWNGCCFFMMTLRNWMHSVSFCY